jgi:hypothetical protein
MLTGVDNPSFYNVIDTGNMSFTSLKMPVMQQCQCGWYWWSTIRIFESLPVLLKDQSVKKTQQSIDITS